MIQIVIKKFNIVCVECKYINVIEHLSYNKFNNTFS
jgi:hypothetical protein